MKSLVLRTLLTALAATVVGFIILRYRDAARDRRELAELRADLALVRAEADRCRTEIANQEDDFRAFDRSVDSLRREVEALEALDERGVPNDRYDEYLSTFNRYNESVAPWEARADSLRARWTACRDIVRRHNELADSLRTRLAPDLPQGGRP